MEEGRREPEHRICRTRKLSRSFVPFKDVIKCFSLKLKSNQKKLPTANCKEKKEFNDNPPKEVILLHKKLIRRAESR